jgi:hypothetical protein
MEADRAALARRLARADLNESTAVVEHALDQDANPWYHPAFPAVLLAGELRTWLQVFPKGPHERSSGLMFLSMQAT